jgi:3-keto-5-aminohexanoate cleavage enzyme
VNTARQPCIICVAITGSLPTKDNNPAVPITVAEQIESTQEAFEAGAAIVHAHVRDDEGKPTSDPDRFAQLMDGIRRQCPGMIVQLSTGGRSGAGRTRGGMLHLRPDMASLSVGSNNFPNRVYENPPDLVDWLAAEMKSFGVMPEIEAFDLSHILKAHQMWRASQITARPYVQFVMGVKNAMPADRDVFDYYVRTVHRLFGETAPWCAAGIGQSQLVLNDWAVSSGGHARTGLEDNVRLDRDRLAPSNAALVRRVVDLCDRYERPVSDWRTARAILGLSAAAAEEAA